MNKTRVGPLGPTPYVWQTADLAWCCSQVATRNVGAREKTILSLSYGRIIRRDIARNEGLLPESFGTYQIVEPGDIVLRLTDLQNDKRSLRTGLVQERGAITSAYVALRTHSQVKSRFLHYLLHAYDVSKLFYRFGGGVRQSMRFEDLRHVPLCFPVEDQQEAIADFLDRKTAAIDALIEKKQRLLELLTEKRAALINQAVTKGLDPDVPMRDSGIPWIGAIPKHWGVKRLKSQLCQSTSGSRGWAEYYSERPGDPLFIQSGNLGRDLTVDLSNIQRVAPPVGAEGERTELNVGDVLICITGARTGAVALVEDQLPPSAYINQHVCLVRLLPGRSDPRFVAIALASDIGKVHFATGQYGGTKQGLGLDDVRNCWLAFPSAAEQRRIGAVVWNKLKEFRQAFDLVSLQIDRLREYRQALITAAVTGQLTIPEVPTS